ncbi:BREX-1 system phosphatase PglZ type B [bacterium]|nr:BREX-1 system phosphatase PglZ type B [bacterium]
MSTVLDALCDYLRARDTARDGEARPCAILWTDPRHEWTPAIERLQQALPELLVLGDYDPSNRAGAAIWLRCVVDGTIGGIVPDGTIPIILLPGVGRQDLQAGQESDELVRPLAELMYRGTMWLQHNGSDWTAKSFLGSNRTLDLDLAKDQQTEAALRRAIAEVLSESPERLRGRRLEANDFDTLLSDDPDRDILLWMNDPAGKQAAMGTERWEALCRQCVTNLGFDPATEDSIVAGEQLGKGDGGWAKVWKRFTEAPESYPGVVEVLLRSTPTDGLFGGIDGARWPKRNEELEEELRRGLEEATTLPPDRAAARVLELETEHAARRGWLWTRIGLAPLTGPLEHLARLAQRTTQPINGSRPDDLAVLYTEDAWQADAASWEAVHAAVAGDVPLIQKVVGHLLTTWLDASARNLQRAADTHPLPDHRTTPPVEATPDQCLVFVDGLRYDLGRRLAERLETRSCQVQLAHRWAALPTVTATAKPAVSPVADKISGGVPPASFAPSVTQTGREVAKPELMSLLEADGYTVLDRNAGLFPENDPSYGWAECGDIDSLGHKLEANLARQIDEELDRITDRIVDLLDRGWKSVRLITDHGWLLAPGGLPRCDLPKHLTESKWARCAVLTAGNTREVSRLPWHWNAIHSVASPPGVACFKAGVEYSHGGLSLQEALVPDLVVERIGGPARRIDIGSVGWKGLRCQVEVPGGDGLQMDLRVGRPNGESVAASMKTVEEGAAAILLGDDAHEDSDLVVVILDSDGQILAQRPTRVGKDS